MLEGKTLDEQMAKERIERERQAAEQKLNAEIRFNQKYIEVQNYFQKDEAEVYKQEDQLVLRLKAVRFPVGQSIIMPENYSLLSKVQKAIQNFNDPGNSFLAVSCPNNFNIVSPGIFLEFLQVVIQIGNNFSFNIRCPLFCQFHIQVTTFSPFNGFVISWNIKRQAWRQELQGADGH